MNRVCWISPSSACGSVTRARLAPVGTERPAVALRVADREVAGPVVGVVQLGDDLGAGRRGPAEQPVRVVGHDVGAEAARLDRPLVVRAALPDRAEHDPAARRPGQLGVVDDVAVAVDDGLLEPEGVDEEADQLAGVAGPHGWPHLRWRCLVAHDFTLPPVGQGTLGRIGTLRPATSWARTR